MTRHRLQSRDEKGAVLVLSVVGVVIACIAAALAVDLGRLASDKRTDQKVADLAALDAARDAANVQTAAESSATRNNFPFASPGYSIAACLSFADGTCGAGGAYVTVRVQSPYKAAFPFVGGVDHTGARATAPTAVTGNNVASFSVGSSLASVDTQKSRLDPLLEGWLGLSTGKLGAVSYNGLATSSISLKLLRTKLIPLNYTLAAGTASELLATDIKAGDLLKATAQALTADGNPTAAAELNKISFSLISNVNVTIGKLLGLSAPGSSSALDTRMNVFQLLTGTAEMVNGSSFIDIPGITVSVPVAGFPLISVTTSLRVIKPAQMASGPLLPTPPTAKNSQVVLRLNISGILAGNVIGLELNGANAQATLSDIRCATGTPGISLGSISTSAATIGGNVALLAGLGSLALSGTAVGSSTATPQSFDYPAQFAPFSRQVGAATLDLSAASITVTSSGPLADASALTVQTALNLLKPALGPALYPVTGNILQPTLRALGAEVSAADLTALSMDPIPPGCNRPHITG